MSEVKTKYREPWYLSNDNGTEEWCITNGVETFPLTEASSAEFGLALNGTIERAHVVPQPDRDALYSVVVKAFVESWNEGTEHEYTPDAITDAVIVHLSTLAALSTQPAAGEVEWGVLFRDNGRVEKRASREKATGRASEFTRIETRDGKLVREIPPSDPERGRALVSRTVTPWVEARPAAQPTELAELFPGTLAALDRLSIRPEVQP